jgi:hypothetical protein
VRYQVYVVELSQKVFTENANPQFNGVLECLYVGMTSKTRAERLKQHKTGYVNKKGHKLSPNIVQNTPLPQNFLDNIYKLLAIWSIK